MYYQRRGMSGVIQDISAAIARQENVPAQYNNPGGLIAAPGCTSRPGQIAICPDAATGEADLERQVQLYAGRGASIADMIHAWAPACNQPICAGNNPDIYTSNVATWTGLDPNTPINLLAAGGAPDVMAAGAIDTAGFIPGLDFGSLDWGTIIPLAVVVLVGGLLLWE
jgi:hypothetical protein